MKTLLAFLNIVLPQVPQMAALFRSAFSKVGGKDADFDKILADNQIDIDRLAHPDSFRRAPTHEPPPTNADAYSVIYDSIPDDSLFASGDRVYRSQGAPTKWRAEKGSDPEVRAGGWDLDHRVA